jgi:hypothetical protein
MQTVLILGLVSLFTDISSEMVYPLLSLYLTTTLGATPAIVGIIEGIAESLASLLKTCSGYLSDKTRKRKPLALLGYGSATIGKLFLYFSTSWGWVLTGRVVDRFGKGVRTAPRDALIAEASQANQLGHSFRAILPINSYGGLLWDLLGPTAPFYFGGGVGVAAALGIYFIVPKQAPAACVETH